MESILDVTVVLTLFKRPEMLRRQLEAVKGQSVRPSRIVLFQDHIPSDYEIRLVDDLKAEFDDIREAPENVGVWGRFHYALEAETTYICLFDDDTIPGKRWLENCFACVQKQDGIYGTIGIVLAEKNGYPYRGYYREGWDSCNPDLCEVDFVGHSWFLRREHLFHMFENTENYQALKRASEDMCLSARAQRYGIHTYVPPHPKGQPEWFGSLPNVADSVGRSDAAVSLGDENLRLMNRAVVALQDEGWEPLYRRDSGTVRVGMWRQRRRYWERRWRRWVER